MALGEWAGALPRIRAWAAKKLDVEANDPQYEARPGQRMMFD